MPVPVVVVPPGVRVNVQVPVAGKLLKITLPVPTEQVGCVIVPTIGVEGVDGFGIMITSDDDNEIHPDELVTVKVFVPEGSPDTVVLVPVPVVVVPPGDLVNIQVPADGKPPKITLPVAIEQVGWVIVPTVGAIGVDGVVLITTLDDEGEIHPDELVTV